MRGNPGARNTDPDTSHSAANANPKLREADRRMVLLIHAMFPNGLTDYDLAHHTGRQQNSVGKRRGELRDEGLIAATTERRPAPSGAMCIVWRITLRGIWKAAELRRQGVHL